MILLIGWIQLLLFAGYWILLCYFVVLAWRSWLRVLRPTSAGFLYSTMSPKEGATIITIVALIVASPLWIPRIAYLFEYTRVQNSDIPALPIEPIREFRLSYDKNDTASRDGKQAALEDALNALFLGKLDQFEVEVPDQIVTGRATTYSYKVYSLGPEGSNECVSVTTWAGTRHRRDQLPSGYCLVERVYRNPTSKVLMEIRSSADAKSVLLSKGGQEVAHLHWSRYRLSSLEFGRPRTLVVAKPGDLTESGANFPLRRLLTSPGKLVGTTGAANGQCKLPGQLKNAVAYDVEVADDDFTRLPSVPAMLSSGSFNAGIAELIVNHPGQDVVLRLRSNQPVIWKISRTEKTRIVIVDATGHRGQAVVGIPREIPVIAESTFYYSRRGICQHQQFTEWVRNSREALGTWQRIKIDSSVSRLGKSMESESRRATDANVWAIEDFALEKRQNSTVAGGLKELGEAGKMLKLAQQQADYVFRKLKPEHLVGSDYTSADNAYLAMESFVLPRILDGRSGITLFVPEGVEVPEGELGQSQFLRIRMTKGEILDKLSRISIAQESPRPSSQPVKDVVIIVSILLMVFALPGAIVGAKLGGTAGAKKGVFVAVGLYFFALAALVAFLVYNDVGMRVANGNFYFDSWRLEP